MIDEERRNEIDAATTENPVDLTSDEVAELRMTNKLQFQRDVGAGYFRLPAVEGSPAAIAHQMRNDGRPYEDIALMLGMDEDKVERLLARTYLNAFTG